MGKYSSMLPTSKYRGISFFVGGKKTQGERQATCDVGGGDGGTTRIYEQLVHAMQTFNYAVH